MAKKWLVILAMCATLAASCAKAGGESAVQDGAKGQYRGDLHNTGVFEVSGLPELTGEKWRMQLGGKTNSSPVLAGETLYIGDEAGAFYALNADDGSEIWTFQAQGGIRSSAFVAGGYVYFLDGKSNLYALDTREGKQAWSVELDNQFAEKNKDYWDYYYSSAAVAGDTLYLGSEGSLFYAIDRKDGSVIWSYALGSTVHGKPVVTEDQVYAADNQGKVTALDRKTGELVWSVTHGSIHGGLAYKDGVLYYGSRDQYVYATDANTGKQLWSYRSPSGSWLGSSAAVSEEYVTIGSSDAKVVHIFKRLGGEHHLDFRLPSRVFGSPSIAGKIAYFGSAYTDNSLGIDAFYAIDLESGQELWRFDGTKAPILSSPAIGDGVVYYASQDGFVYALH
ncbi:PQQ-binding-like beta-propeller repeat protein [Paenibacillus sp. NPDC057967]|uniref:outer membrane protein assembly factor BamB family protein n=1 Tax=Paenibacillus sp. NPDC057967 TaxID=3346293 RepID=UPI0036DE5E7B